MIKDIRHALWRWLCRPLKGLLWFVAAYPFLVVVMYYTTDAFFPNRAELRRNIDWQNWSRGDLYLPNGQLIARNVGSLCWNATAVSGWGDPEGFVWLGGDQEVIYASDPGYLATIEASGLGRPTGPCQGFHSTRLEAESLLGQWRSMRSDE